MTHFWTTGGDHTFLENGRIAFAIDAQYRDQLSDCILDI